MKLDLVLYGPSERIIDNAEDRLLFLQYLEQARKCKHISSICYVGSTPLPENYFRYFDKVQITNNRNFFDENSLSCEGITNYNFGYHIVNLQKSHEITDTMKIIVHRIDIIPRNINNLIENFILSKKNFMIDSALNHTKILPFYLSDFFYIGPRKKISLRNLNFRKDQTRKLILNPFNKLSAGKFYISHMYAEYIIWRYFFLSNLNQNTKEPNKHTFIDVVKYWKACSEIKFISRNTNFYSAGKLKGNGSEEWGHEINIFTIAFSFILFLSRSMQIIKNKFSRYI